MGKTVSMKDRIRSRAKEAAAAMVVGPLKIKYEEKKFFQPKTNCLFDIIPYVVSDPAHPEQIDPGELWPRRQYKSHYLTVDGQRRMYICRRSINEPCPICEYYAQMIKLGYKGDEVTSLKVKDRELYNVIDLQNDPKSILLFDCSYHNFGKQLDKDIADDYIGEEYGNFADLSEGFTLRVRFSRESFQTNKFFQASRIDFLPRKKPYPPAILKQVYDLDDILNIQSYEELERVLFNMEDFIREDYQSGASDGAKDFVPEANTETETDIDDSMWSKGGKKEEQEQAPPPPKAGRPPKATPPPPEPEPEPEPEIPVVEEEDYLQEEDVRQMSRPDLLALIADEQLEINPKEYRAVGDLQEAIIGILFSSMEYTAGDILAMKRPELLQIIVAEELPITSKQSHGASVPELQQMILDQLGLSEPEPEKAPGKTLPVDDASGSYEEGVCPEGFVFGEEHGTYTECEECAVWGDCDDARAKLEAETSKSKLTKPAPKGKAASPAAPPTAPKRPRPKR